jgi:DNA-binding GntR family transcriptional regulator
LVSKLSELLDIRSTWARPEDRALTTVDIAVRKLRTAIILGRLQPGQKLVEADLCNDLEISRASLRETLRILAVERLIVLVPNRGPFVARLGTREVEDIHEVWALLTGEAVYRFAQRAEPSDVAELGDALTALRQALKTGDAYSELAATNRFFSIILYHCGNDVLIETVIGLVSRINFLRSRLLLHGDWGALYGPEMEALVEAVRSRDGAAAREAVREHIHRACLAAQALADVTPEPAGRGRLGGPEVEPVRARRARSA